MRAIVYCNGQPALDGRVPLDALPDLLPDVARGDIAERDADGGWKAVTIRTVLERAIEARLFDDIEQDPVIGEVAPIHDYLDHNKSGAERAVESDMKAQAARKRHVSAPPTERDSGSGQFTSHRAAAPPPHGNDRAGRTGPTVPTSTTDTPSTTSVPTQRTGTNGVKPTDDDWVTFGREWEPVRDAMAERGYRLPPMGGQDIEGTQRKLLWDLVQNEGGEAVAAHMRRAPAELRKRRRFYDLVGWVLDDRDARLDAIGPDQMPIPRERSAETGVERLDDIVGRTLSTRTAKAVKGDESESESDG